MVELTRFCGFCAWCMLVVVCPSGSLDCYVTVHCPCLYVRDAGLPSEGRCGCSRSRSACSVVAVLYLCSWLLALHWRCMLAVFSLCVCFVLSGALRLSSLLYVLLGCLVSTGSSAFFVHPLFNAAIHFRPSTLPLSSSLQHFVMYVLPFCVSPRQPALIWILNVKALHFNEQQLFKAKVLVAWYTRTCLFFFRFFIFFV